MGSRLPGMPGENGMSSNRMRWLHSKTHLLIAAMRFADACRGGVMRPWRARCLHT